MSGDLNLKLLRTASGYIGEMMNVVGAAVHELLPMVPVLLHVRHYALQYRVGGGVRCPVGSKKKACHEPNLSDLRHTGLLQSATMKAATQRNSHSKVVVVVYMALFGGRTLPVTSDR